MPFTSYPVDIKLQQMRLLEGGSAQAVVYTGVGMRRLLSVDLRGLHDIASIRQVNSFAPASPLTGQLFKPSKNSQLWDSSNFINAIIFPLCGADRQAEFFFRFNGLLGVVGGWAGLPTTMLLALCALKCFSFWRQHAQLREKSIHYK